MECLIIHNQLFDVLHNKNLNLTSLLTILWEKWLVATVKTHVARRNIRIIRIGLGGPARGGPHTLSEIPYLPL